MPTEIRCFLGVNFSDEDVVVSRASSDDRPLTIDFKFIMDVDSTVWRQDGTQSPVLVQRHDFPTQEVHIRGVPEDDVRKCVKDGLRPWFTWWRRSTGISGVDRNLIAYAVVEASAQIRRLPPGHDYIQIPISVILQLERILRFDPANYMRPAAESAVEGLTKRGKVSAEDRCAICLEDFEEGFLTMPCCHNFHGDCLKRWLGISHYCPTCRYQMPFDV